jgi:hypothetical protein
MTSTNPALGSSRKMRLTCTGYNYQLNITEGDKMGRERYQNGTKIGRERKGHRKRLCPTYTRIRGCRTKRMYIA